VALTQCSAALRQFGDQPELLLMLGAIKAANGEREQGVAAFRRCIVLAPELADAYANIGSLLVKMGKVNVAIVAHRRAVTLVPDNSDFWTMLAAANLTKRDYKEARCAFEKALRLKPESLAAHSGRGRALLSEGEIEKAILAHRSAVVIAPDSAEAWHELGHSARRHDPILSVNAYERAVRLAPENGIFLSDLFVSRRSICDWHEHDLIAVGLRSMIEEDRSVILPLGDLLLDMSSKHQGKAARRFAGDFLGKAQPWQVADLLPDPEALLTIAYLSGDFQDHATAYLAAEIFERHDRSRFRVLAYSYGLEDHGYMRKRLNAGFDAFRDIRQFDADQVGSLAARDDVNILVDLKGYTAGSRLDLLSRRLAPIQVSWLGYPGTLGTHNFDYVIGDRTVTPVEYQPWFTENIVRLPDTYQPNDRKRPLPSESNRAAIRLPDKAFVFGALHAPHKIGPALFMDWMQILHAVPGSVLWLYAPNEQVRKNLQRCAAGADIAPDRLVFAAPMPQADHIKRLAAADLMLDSFPYTGHTTTSDALWAGVPVVTRMGEGFAARVAASLLRAAGVPELITRSRDSYVDLAVGLAHDRLRLADLQRKLIERRLSCSLFDSASFVRHLEAGYRIMWHRHAAGLPPSPIDVQPVF
jgi:protein O-GlcNAc transferase